MTTEGVVMSSTAPVRASSSKQIVYDRVICEVFDKLRASNPAATEMDFAKFEIEDAIDDLVSGGHLAARTKNIPDIKYTYDARKDFPAAIAATGHWAIIGRGKGLYRFITLPQNNLIRIPADLPSVGPPLRVQDTTPTLVNAVLGNDEQATMTRVRYNRTLDDFTGLTTYHVQGHERTTVSAGQIEVDEVYVGAQSAMATAGEVIPISAKGGNDYLSYTQALNLNLYAAEKQKYSGFGRRPIGVAKARDGAVYVLEFSTDLDIRQIRIVKHTRYVFV
jgi:hypothetical protein